MNLSKSNLGRIVLKRASSTYSPEVLLSKENQKRCLKIFRGMMVNQDTSQTARQAAVLIPICIVNGKVSLLYTLRAADLKTHRGQVSFPGGMHDEGDKTLEDTALRETHEELGIHPKSIEIWGRGNFIMRNEMSILPIIGCIKSNISPETIKLNVNEVEDVFTVSIEDLCNPELFRHTQFRGMYCAPAYLAGPHRVWGLTALMTYFFLKAMLPDSYKQKLPYVPKVERLIKKS